MLYWLAPLVVLGLVVFVHEFGHFLAAKAVGRLRAALLARLGQAARPLATRRRRDGVRDLAAARSAATCAWRRATTRRRRCSRAATRRSKEGAELRSATGIPNAMMPHGPKPVPADRWFESKPHVRARRDPARRRDDERACSRSSSPRGSSRVVRPARRADGDRHAGAGEAGRSAPGLQRGDSVIAVDGDPVRSWSASSSRRWRADTARRRRAWRSRRGGASG